MNEHEQPPPEMQLVERARNAPPKMSVTAAAKRAGMSEGRWRQLAKGYQQVDRETRVATTAPAETLARMARAVGVGADELVEAKRDDAAALVRESPEWEPTDPDHVYRNMRSAVMAATKQMTALIGLAVEQDNVAVMSVAAHAITELTGLLPQLLEWRDQEGEGNDLETEAQSAASAKADEDKEAGLPNEAQRRAAAAGSRIKAVGKGVGGEDAIDGQ